MINTVEIQLFKCFELLKLPLRRLSLLTGSNASGKSSVLQALLLLHQTAREHEWSTRLLLNGSTVSLGTVADVVDKVHGRHSFSIGLDYNELSCHWTFLGDREAMSMAVQEILLNGVEHSAPRQLHHLLPVERNNSVANLAERLVQLTYLTAERVGPREIYPLEDPEVSVVGARGENTASLLFWGQDEPVLSQLMMAGTPPTRLRQVSERMRWFFPGCGIAVQAVPQANGVTLGLRTSDDTDFHRPVHVGFGLTQVLPIVVSALSAKPGDVLIVENPEVHLHPAGQSQMGQFLSLVAQAGVQVIIETHSDHVLNGVRRSVRERALRAEDVAIHFFRPRILGGAQVVSPILDSQGHLDGWPEGFFDQYDRDSAYFADWG